MISTQHLTADQLAQLDALLADTTPGGGLYRPPVARDVWILRDLEHAHLCRFTVDCGYEITDTGRAAVVERAIDAANTQVFALYATDDELHAAIGALKVAAETADEVVRERALTDIEACQDELDRRDAEDRSESTGRHRVVPADDRPTEVLPAAVEQTIIGSSSGTLTGLPVVESDGTPCDPDEQATIRLLAAIRATPSPDELAEIAAINTAGWDALEADLGDDDRSWLRRKLRPHRVLILSIVAAVVVTWFVAWLVMG